MNNITQLQSFMKEQNINAYIIPTSDFHGSEYVSNYFKGREFLSGFTGSAGTLVITQSEARLWTDGRYHIQASHQLDGSGIILMRQGNKDVISIGEYLDSVLNDKLTLAFDGRVLPYKEALSYISCIKTKININNNIDLVDDIWLDRPQLPFSLIYYLDEFFSGEAFKSKLNRIRAIMKENNCTHHILTSLEDQAWIYNLRASDVAHTPVFLSYTIITEGQCYLYVDSKKIDNLVDKYLNDNNITVKPYFEFYDVIKNIKDKNILVDYNKINYTCYSSIVEKNKLINKQNPTLLFKSIKNTTEIENIKNAHVKDGLAVTKFMKYLKETSDSLTELSLSEYLKDLRSKMDGYIDLSFETICAFNENAAMMHYCASSISNSEVKGNGMLLVDSGGHYLEGTTDITRIFGIGNPTKQMKDHFTIVLKSVIALSSVVFLKGVRGVNLDVLARGPIWKELIDYKCGTGHGVGYLLSVHEGPNSFRWQTERESEVLVEGMITTNEPGIYLENKYGIRIENEMLCKFKGTSEFGDFLEFETITYAPIDLDLINPLLLNDEEKKWLNSYHQTVYKKLSPLLSKEEKNWLKKYTNKI